MRRLACLAVALLALGACSGDDDDVGTTTTTPATTTTAAPVAPVAPEDVAAAPSAGCEGGDTLAPGEQQRTVTSSGRDRAYAIHVPTAATGGEPLPLVVDYHGLLEGGPIHALHSMLGAYGEEQGFVTVTPDSGYEVPVWSIDPAGEDVALFGDLLDQVGDESCIDASRVFVTGLSNGAMMTSALACAYSDRIAATAPVAGILLVDGCEPERPVPFVAFHGTDDTWLSFDGGVGQSAVDTLTGEDGGPSMSDVPEDVNDVVGEGPSVPEVAAAWAERNGCEAEPTEERVSPEVVRQVFSCPAGAESELYVVEGGGHTWPGSDFDDSIVSIVGHVTHDIDANELMWAFFQAHPLSS